MQLLILQVSRQAREVVGLLGAANGFRQVTSGQKGIAARRVVSQVLHSLSKLGDALGGILPSQIYVQAAGQVLQAVLETVIGEAVTVSPQVLALHRLYISGLQQLLAFSCWHYTGLTYHLSGLQER